jgi:hypothetical protein
MSTRERGEECNRDEIYFQGENPPKAASKYFRRAYLILNFIKKKKPYGALRNIPQGRLPLILYEGRVYHATITPLLV